MYRVNMVNVVGNSNVEVPDLLMNHRFYRCCNLLAGCGVPLPIEPPDFEHHVDMLLQNKCLELPDGPVSPVSATDSSDRSTSSIDGDDLIVVDD